MNIHDFKNRNTLEGNKEYYLPLDNLGLMLVHKRLHFTQLQLQKPAHRQNKHQHAMAWLPLVPVHRQPLCPASTDSHLSDCTDKGISAFSLQQEANMAGLVRAHRRVLGSRNGM